MGSPLSTHLLTSAAQDVLADGRVADLLVPRARPGRGDAAALRFLAALHRLVLTGRAPQLAAHYPTVGGSPDHERLGGALLATVRDHLDTLAVDVERPCQTNEAGRAAGLVVGLLDVAARTRLPIALREVGASAGLNLRLDAWRYELPGGVVIGDPRSTVVLTGRWDRPVPHHRVPWPIVDRRGCDLAPVDIGTDEGQLQLAASVWGDQPARLELLRAAMREVSDAPVVVDAAAAADWTRRHLVPEDGRVTVLTNAVVEEYLTAAERNALDDAVAAAARRASTDAPVAWLRMEPSTRLRRHAVSVRIWPQAPVARDLATTDGHGGDVRILAGGGGGDGSPAPRLEDPPTISDGG